MKEKLVSKLGGLGFVLWWIISIVVAALPVVMINPDTFISIGIIALTFLFPASSVVFWIWGLVCTLRSTQDIFSIIYYISFVVLFLPFFISAFMKILSFIGGIFVNRRYKRNGKRMTEDNQSNALLADENENREDIAVPTENTEQQEISDITKEDTTGNKKRKNKKIRYCKLCGGLIDQKSRICTKCGKKYFKFKKNAILPIILSLALTVSVIGNIEMYDELSFYEWKIEQLEKDLEEEKEENFEKNDARFFLTMYIAIIDAEKPYYYHRYGCELLDTTKSILAYNDNEAENRGYEPCPQCH